MEENNTNELLSAIKEFGDKITAVETDVKASRAAIDEKIKAISDEQAKAAKDLNEVLQKAHHENAAGTPAQVKTAGQTFIESAGYKSMISGEQKSFRLAFKDAIGSQASNSVSRDSIVVPAQGAFVGIPDDTGTKIQDLIPTVQTASNMVEYLRSSDITNNAAFVAEAAQKPESAFTFNLENCKIETVAHWVRLTRQAYEDAPLVASYIMNKLLIGLRKTIEAQILNGDGTSPNLLGLLTAVSDDATDAGVAKGDTLIDFVLKVKNHIETLNYTPNILILNPAQWTTLSLMKNNMGEYLLGGPAMVAGKSIWGLSVLTSGAVPSGKYILGSLQEGCTIYQRMGAEMMASFDDASNFTTNLVTLRAEERLGFAVEDPNALSAGDFSIPTSS